MLSELEEIALGLPETILQPAWQHRLSLAQANVEVWLRVLKVRSLIFPPSADEALWIKFAGMCRKNSRPQMAQKILSKLLGEGVELSLGMGKIKGGADRFTNSFLDDRSILNALNLGKSNPTVIYAYLKFLWECGSDRMQALRLMKTFARFLGRMPTDGDAASSSGTLKLLAQVHYKWSKWEKQLITENSTGPSKSEKNILGSGFTL